MPCCGSIRGLIRSALEDDGFSVREASSAATALKLCAEQPPDVVFELGRVRLARTGARQRAPDPRLRRRTAPGLVPMTRFTRLPTWVQALLAVAAGDNVVRFLAPLIVTEAEIAESVQMLERACVALSGNQLKKAAG